MSKARVLIVDDEPVIAETLSEMLAGVRVACIGGITAQTAAEYGLRADIQPSEFTTPALARAVADFFGDTT